MNVIRPSFVRSLVAIAVTAALLAGCGGGEQQQHAPPPPEVTVQTVERNPVPLDLTYTARTVGSREVEVRARVGGILLKRRYQEGGPVKQGQPLFLIDPEPVRARLASARAEVAVAKARFEEARRERDRVLPLFDKNAVSQSRRDEVVSTFEVAQASLAAAEAAQRMAELDLEYTDVRAPISGLSSREVMSEGSLVSTEQSSSLLTKIVQVDPLYVEFSVPEAEAALIRASLAPANKSNAPTVRLLLENGQEYKETAKVTFVDNAVDVNSGTVRVRAVLSNPQAELIPGQFIRARVDGVLLSNVVAVPRKAIMSSAQGQFIWIVNGEQKIEFRPVQLGRSMGNNIIVTEGLAPGDRYVVEGVLKVQPGIQVSAVSVDAASQQAEQQPAAQPMARGASKETA
ncbi:efflux RND transporter periplasmic adaptor subunit [Steroidobacter sp. S1-65]|uniref:Efflux RND transporter periplasmic adaptor subunit n=1 Tax=Steroidobacter gossypii TaxID=2805490 RepID=A0ABS1X6H9_9GAMM|nr:efflux RND transporter periplasmic adaptor subunit [Steroidobacter gossypii]MBM0108832.1 efflux RND transporter periplasmic adaptor subunit [Steroidobacter gossypii]